VAAGTGFIISKDGLILTNNHVVEDASKIEGALFGENDSDYRREAVGRDPLTDSALIQLTEKPNHTLPRPSSATRRRWRRRLGDGHRQPVRLAP
jgi:S1-C subfamily serine protease